MTDGSANTQHLHGKYSFENVNSRILCDGSLVGKTGVDTCWLIALLGFKLKCQH